MPETNDICVAGFQWRSTRGPLPVLVFVLDRRSVSDRGVQPAVVKPADVGDSRELELRVGLPHAVGDQTVL